jgi:hypothetical protein
MPEVAACCHINRSDHPENDCQRHAYPIQIELDYCDGHELSGHHIAVLGNFIGALTAHKVSTLVHCYAGTCRSPTVAAYILAMVDGLHPIDAFFMVDKAVYLEREGRETINLVHRPKKQICDLVMTSR